MRGGKLISADPAEPAPGGQPVHAGSFIRRREIVLDCALAGNRRELARILAHEICHFAWPRLGNSLRHSYENLLVSELRRKARGELGWSAEWRKQELRPRDILRRTRRWREYVCESFCDTGAWVLSARRHAEQTLAPRFRNARRRWFEDAGLLERIPV